MSLQADSCSRDHKELLNLREFLSGICPIACGQLLLSALSAPRLGTSLRDAGTPLVATSRADGQGDQGIPHPQTALPKEGGVSHTKNASAISNPIKMDPLAITIPSPKAVALLKITHTSSCLLFPQAWPNYPVIGIFSSLLGKTRREDPSYGEERVWKQYYCACWHRHSTTSSPK